MVPWGGLKGKGPVFCLFWLVLFFFGCFGGVVLCFFLGGVVFFWKENLENHKITVAYLCFFDLKRLQKIFLKQMIVQKTLEKKRLQHARGRPGSG